MIGEAEAKLGAQRRTLSSQLYDILQSKILLGELPPGDRISEESLAETYGVSRSPAREALADLERVGLAVRVGMRDRMITVPSYEMISEKFDLWWIVDVGRTYLACLTAEPADIDEMRRYLDRMAGAVKRRDGKRYKLACDKFHAKIRLGCSNTYVNRLGADCDIYLHWFENLYDRAPEFSADAVEEHIRILDAYEKKDLPGLSESIRIHIQRQKTRILDHFQVLEAAKTKQPALLRNVLSS